MFKRILMFAFVIVLVGAVSAFIYFNRDDQTLTLWPEFQYTLPIGAWLLGFALSGALVMFLFGLLREGRHAFNEWRVNRGIRNANRTAEMRAEARSLSLAGEYKRARALFSKATKARQPDVGDVIDYAGTYLLEGEPQEARKHLEDGQKDFGNDPLLLYALARSYKADGDDAAAISALERASAVYPNSLKLSTMLRDLLFANGQWEKAKDVQEKIVRAKPDDDVEKNWLLGSQFEAALAKEGEERDSVLRSISGSAPDFIPVVIERARALAAADDSSGAIKLLEKTAKRIPHSAVLAELAELAGKDESGRHSKFLTKLVATFTDNDDVRLQTARFLVESGRAEEAREILNARSEIAERRETSALRGAIEEAAGNTTEAMSQFRTAATAAFDSFINCSCDACGQPSNAWKHRCAHCGAWGTLSSKS